MTRQLPEGTVAVFDTLCGATVALVHEDGAAHAYAYTWACLGCQDGSDIGRPARPVRTEANQHAGLCRSKPLPATD